MIQRQLRIFVTSNCTLGQSFAGKVVARLTSNHYLSATVAPLVDRRLLLLYHRLHCHHRSILWELTMSTATRSSPPRPAPLSLRCLYLTVITFLPPELDTEISAKEIQSKNLFRFAALPHLFFQFLGFLLQVERLIFPQFSSLKKHNHSMDFFSFFFGNGFRNFKKI